MDACTYIMYVCCVLIVYYEYVYLYMYVCGCTRVRIHMWCACMDTCVSVFFLCVDSPSSMCLVACYSVSDSFVRSELGNERFRFVPIPDLIHRRFEHRSMG